MICVYFLLPSRGPAMIGTGEHSFPSEPRQVCRRGANRPGLAISFDFPPCRATWPWSAQSPVPRHWRCRSYRCRWRGRLALFGARGDVLKPDGGPVVTVMDFGRSFPLDPLPSGWKHQKFWTRAPMTVAFTVKDGVPSMRFETHDSGSMLFRHVDIDLATY